KIWNGLENFRGDAQLYTWIYRIASNEAINFLNRKKRKAQVPLEDVQRVLEDQLETDPLVGGDEIQRSEEHTSELQSRENLVCRLDRHPFTTRRSSDLKFGMGWRISGETLSCTPGFIASLPMKQ